jgi:hypothetical protein
MSKLLEELTPVLEDFIRQQHLFFVATARKEGRVNLSPKGMDTFRILNANKIVWLNLTGSGNETAAHLAANPRMTIMFCAFEGKPLILRLYGQAQVYHERDETYQQYIGLFEADAGARQIITLEIDLVQTSCGYAVPVMTYEEERTLLKNWSNKQGRRKMKQYWKDNNQVSLDGDDTAIFSSKQP